MASTVQAALPGSVLQVETPVVDRIADVLRQQDWCVMDDALPFPLLDSLIGRATTLRREAMRPAGIGREADHALDRRVRRDRIRWIAGECEAEKAWLQWAESLRVALNRRLLLGLFSFESHFAHYGPGDFYLRHLDAFRDQPLSPDSNRVISVVLYLNPDWDDEDGGQLVIHDRSEAAVVQRVLPLAGRLAVFLSDCVPHEVLPAVRDRHSIAGWFRRNGSTADLVDPPR